MEASYLQTINMPSKKIDYKKDYKQLYFPPTSPVLVDVPGMVFLSISGKGYPQKRGNDAVLLLKKRGKKGSFAKAQLKRWKEGKSAQLMHIGPYNKEEPNIRKLLAFIKEKKLKVAGKHHEIYLSDPRRVAPSKLKAVIRYPVKHT